MAYPACLALSFLLALLNKQMHLDDFQFFFAFHHQVINWVKNNFSLLNQFWNEFSYIMEWIKFYLIV